MTEYRNWHNVPNDLQTLVRQELRSLSWDIAPLIAQGFAFTLEGDSKHRRIARMVQSLHELTDTQRQDAKREKSPWKLVLPLEGSSNHKHVADYEYAIPEDLHKHTGKKTHSTRNNWQGFRVR